MLESSPWKIQMIIVSRLLETISTGKDRPEPVSHGRSAAVIQAATLLGKLQDELFKDCQPKLSVPAFQRVAVMHALADILIDGYEKQQQIHPINGKSDKTVSARR